MMQTQIHLLYAEPSVKEQVRAKCPNASPQTVREVASYLTPAV